MTALEPAAPTFPAVATEILTSIYQHRLLSTGQVHRMHLHNRSRRWAERVLVQLARRGLTAFVRPGRGGPRLYFLTLAGAQAVELIPTRAETRRKLITPDQAAGPLWRHTLAVNETGIAFMQAAREGNDDFGALAWRHEIAHRVASGGSGRGERLISDALLTYLAFGNEGELTFHYRLLELDRATVPTDTLATKLGRYARLFHQTADHDSAWQERYPIFPDIICVLADQPRAALLRRMQTVLAICREDVLLTQTPQVRLSLVLLDDLQAHGPFASIWRRPEDPSETFDWMGRPARGAR